MKSKLGVCVLLFAFLLLPVSTHISFAADEAVQGDKEGAKVAQVAFSRIPVTRGAIGQGPVVGNHQQAQKDPEIVYIIKSSRFYCLCSHDADLLIIDMQI